MQDLSRDLLRGAVDLHIHAAPDIVPRLLDDLALAKAARDAGMAGIVLKSHHMLTADRAQIAQSVVPDLRIFGGLALNFPACGGLNSEAVKVALRMGARIVWLPTLSAANHIERTKTRVTGNLGVMSQGFKPQPVPVVDGNGVVMPDLIEILRLIAEADIILATGHLSVREIKTVVDAAVATGVRKILVNHPDLWLIGMSIEDERELAAKGAMLEMCIRSVTAPGHGETSPRFLADRIKAVGAAHVVMATDYGQVDSPPAPEGMHWYIAQMLECGIPPKDVELMAKVNPARLLGL
ncbi:MAG TPA: DUF6282 family protein [Candidatus Methylomirabilis sp.]|nr:DUF6282 family protein [Candidatus Methylomirabilis sp.]